MRNLLRYALLLAFSTASYNALAMTITPTATFFTATGSILLKAGSLPSFTCAVLFTGSTSPNGTATITSVSFSGGGLCATASASGLPWTLTATSLTSMTLAGIKLTVAGMNCTSTPAVVYASWSNSLSALVTTAQPVGSCTIQNLAITTNPPLVVSY